MTSIILLIFEYWMVLSFHNRDNKKMSCTAYSFDENVNLLHVIAGFHPTWCPAKYVHGFILLCLFVILTLFIRPNLTIHILCDALRWRCKTMTPMPVTFYWQISAALTRGLVQYRPSTRNASQFSRYIFSRNSIRIRCLAGQKIKTVTQWKCMSDLRCTVRHRWWELSELWHFLNSIH